MNEHDNKTEAPMNIGRMSLADAVQAARDGNPAFEETLDRIAPKDGSRTLLVAAGFNSAI